MNKKLLVVAVASALGVPALAHADSNSVQIYGKLYEEYGFASPGSISGKGSAQNVDILQAPSSNIGFKGEENLGGGMAAWFQCESTADPRGVNGADGSGGFCSRNSAVGLKGTFGNVWVGVWDTPFKRVTTRNLIADQTGLYGAAYVLGGGATTVTGGTDPSLWFRRQRESINYDSPNFDGFKFMVSTNTGNSATSATSAAVSAKPRVLSLGAVYDNGPLNVTAGYERHSDFIPTYSGTDHAWSLGAGYLIGPVRLGAIYMQQKYEPAAGQDLKVNSYNLAALWRLGGPHAVRLSYTSAGDTSGNYVGTLAGNNETLIGNAGAGDTGAKLWQIAYVHDFSKQTEGTVGYVKLNNDNNAQFSLGGLSAPNPGENQDAWVMSISHKF